MIVFRHLNDDDLKHVVDLELSKVRERLEERGLKLELTDEAKEFLIKKGSNPDFGARPLRRAIENFIEDPLAEELLKGEFEGKDTITVEVKKVGDKKQLVFDGSVSESAEPAVGAMPAARKARLAGINPGGNERCELACISKAAACCDKRRPFYLNISVGSAAMIVEGVPPKWLEATSTALCDLLALPANWDSYALRRSTFRASSLQSIS